MQTRSSAFLDVMCFLSVLFIVLEVMRGRDSYSLVGKRHGETGHPRH